MTAIVATEAVPDGSSHLFRVRSVESGEEREAILVGLEEGMSGWLNYCQHMTHVKLDKGSGATLRNGEILCANHGAMFESASGRCTHGPCQGAYLEAVGVEVRDGMVHLADDGYEYVGPGPLEEEDPGDLSSTSNLEF